MVGQIASAWYKATKSERAWWLRTYQRECESLGIEADGAEVDAAMRRGLSPRAAAQHAASLRAKVA